MGKNMIVIKIAGLAIGIENRFLHLRYQSMDYLTDEEPVFTVKVLDEEIAAERKNYGEDCPDAYCESIIAYRKIAERLPEFDAFLFHGSVIEYRGRAYIITADSGVGKSTHTRLWMSEFGDEVSIINGDKPTLRVIDGVTYASGTPWRGKEGYGKNAMCPVGGFIFLSRADNNRASAIEPKEALTRFMRQIYLPKKKGENLIKTMKLADRVLREVRLVSLECNMDKEAAHVCRRALLDGNE